VPDSPIRRRIMEYVIVRFPEPRTVLIDGRESGQTDTTIIVNEGTHTFRLKGPQDYKPSYRRVMVTLTNDIEPMEVIFEKK
jgi:hypothetical protein